ncbi:MAG: hypothetical protein ACREV6_15895 [Clostridium sp.]|uniref:hypothetical protein n=1 Tax=Clostridium sp. TaxID=1506 RepID=UPI003D6D8951
MYYFFEFEINNEDKFKKLQDFYYAIKLNKDKAGIISNDLKWIDYFDEDTLMKFWWPSSDDLKVYVKLWGETPVEERFICPRLQHPWDFESMIDAFANGGYELISCKKLSEKKGRIEYNPWSWPYGGADSFRALI